MTDRGETLVLVPGLACTRELFAAQISALASTWRIHVAEVGRDNSIPGMAARILGTVRGPFALAGLSMGGYVAFEVLRQDASRVTRLALLDTTAAADAEPARRRRSDLIAHARTGRLDRVHAALWPRLVAPDRLADSALEAVVRGMLERTGAETFIRQQTAILNRRDAGGDLAGIQVPTLVVVGEHDAITPVSAASEIAAGIASAELVVLREAGHLSPLEAPAAVTAALSSWLGG